mmetsp:Transcript_58763/g.137176  ORF Transcript_58763/g.137176 Transcript_58763/m.137176 type:complete len:421 (-) Transcript_58763:24-1286(-)
MSSDSTLTSVAPTTPTVFRDDLHDRHAHSAVNNGVMFPEDVPLTDASLVRASHKPTPRYVPDRPVKPGEIREAKEDNLYRYPPVDDCGYGSGPEVPEEPEVLEDISELSDEEYHPRTPPTGNDSTSGGQFRNASGAGGYQRQSYWKDNSDVDSITTRFSDQVIRPSVPLAQASSVASFRAGEQPQSARALKDEEMWQARKQVTGAVGRLVFYEKGQRPSDDILGLARTPGGHVMVTAVRSAGPAAQAGVTTGHKLVSIDGQKSFMGVATDDILRGLVGPVSLVFLGFVGKVLAEVQVDQPGAPSCGLPEVTDIGLSVLPKDEPVELRNATLFQSHDGSLLLSTGDLRDGSTKSDGLSSRARSRNGDGIDDYGGSTKDEDDELEDMGADPEPVFELQRKDARFLLRSALTASAAATPMYYI